MSCADSFTIAITNAWQNLYDVCAAKAVADGMPAFNKFCRELNLEAPAANSGTVFWSRSPIGTNIAGELLASQSITRTQGGPLQNQNMYLIYVKGSDGNQSLYVSRAE